MKKGERNQLSPTQQLGSIILRICNTSFASFLLLLNEKCIQLAFTGNLVVYFWKRKQPPSFASLLKGTLFNSYIIFLLQSSQASLPHKRFFLVRFSFFAFIFRCPSGSNHTPGRYQDHCHKSTLVGIPWPCILLAHARLAACNTI